MIGLLSCLECTGSLRREGGFAGDGVACDDLADEDFDCDVVDDFGRADVTVASSASEGSECGVKC